MFNISQIRNPDGSGPTRRTLLRIGAVGSLALPELLRCDALAESSHRIGETFGRAKQIMLIYLQGAASQFETWDPKPDAPAEIRGEFGAMQTAVPGTHICDRLPKLARLVDRIAIVRSMTHPYNNHSNHYTLTGYPTTDFGSETNPLDERHHPFFASVLEYLAAQKLGHRVAGIPSNIGLPQRFSKNSLVQRSGPYGAFLGSGFNPVWTEFNGKATTKVDRVSFFAGGKSVEVEDPYLGIRPQDRLLVSRNMQLPRGLNLDRIEQRLSLLEQLESAKGRIADRTESEGIDRFHKMAHSLITSGRLTEALDIGRESDATRASYGMNLFGQSVLTGRRLLEAGCRLVSVFWDEYRVVNTAWDTHFNHFSRLGSELLPGLDSAVSNLLTDLEDRGMLDETLVMCLTEHGRTPKINKLDRGGGRDHWSDAYSVMLFGGGIQGGVVVGESDDHGAFVKNRPVSPEDILATMYHLKGIAPDTTIPDRLQRPIWLTRSGDRIDELLS